MNSFADRGIHRSHNRSAVLRLWFLHSLRGYTAHVPLDVPHIVLPCELPQFAVHRVRIQQDGAEMRRLLLPLQETHAVPQRDGHR